MLYTHFVEEVRNRDQTGSGRLNLREFGGEADLFSSIDVDNDGQVDARDLMRVALERNAELRWMVSGPWSPIYNRVLGVRGGSEDELRAAVVRGVKEAFEQEHIREQARILNRHESHYEPDVGISGEGARPAVLEEEIMGAFLNHHPDLPRLHARIQDLADRLGRFRPYYSVDLWA